MRAKYFSEDGKEFDSKEECLAYEKEKVIGKYNKFFLAGSLKERADRVIDLFDRSSNARCLGDDTIEEAGRESRRSGEACIAGDYSYGILYLRDDAVNILVERIRELEKKLEEKAKKK